MNECEDVPAVCDINAICHNTDGSYMCICSSGYTGDGSTCTGECKCTHFSLYTILNITLLLVFEFYCYM